MAAEDLNQDNEYKKILLANSILLNEADDKTIDLIASQVTEVSVKKGEPLYVENEPGDSLFFLSSGAVEIIKNNKVLRRTQRLAVYKSGEYFSELSSLTGSSHSTSCFALQDSTLLELNSKDFIDILKTSPTICHTFLKNISYLSMKFVNDHGYIHPFVQPRDENLFLSEQIHKDDMAEKGFVAVTGNDRSVTVAMEDPFDSSALNIVKTAHPKTLIKLFSIRSNQINEVLANNGFVVPEEDLKVHSQPISEKIDLGEFKERCTLLESLGKTQLTLIKKHASEQHLKPGDSLFVPNTIVEKLYLVESGALELCRTIEAGVSAVVYKAGEGDCLGEIGLLAGKAENLTARATEPTRVLAIPADVFHDLLATPQFSVSLAQVVARRLQTLSNSQSVKYRNLEISQHVAVTSSLMPIGAIQKYGILPFQKEGNSIKVGVIDPFNKELNEIINRYLADYSTEIYAIPQKRFSEIVEKLTDQSGELAPAQTDRKYNRHLLDEILTASIDRRASSIHIEPLEDRYTIRFRVDGELWEYDQVYPEIGMRLANRIKVAAKLDLNQTNATQDGRITKSIGTEIRLANASVMPTEFGEKVVLHWASATTPLIPLNMLIPDTETIKFLKEVLKSHQGVFIVTGPERSGRKGTIYSCLEEINSMKLNINTIESPVSLRLQGINQVGLRDDRGPSQLQALEIAGKQEADVIFIEDMVSPDVANLAFELAQRGTLVIASMFSMTSVDILDNLSRWGVSNSQLANQLLGVMAQRLIPKLCDSCRRTRAMTASQKRQVKTVIKDLKTQVLWEPRTCHDCSQTGYKGRVTLLEHWKRTPEIRDALLSGESMRDVFKLIEKSGFKDMRENGYQMALNGLTTVDQVEKHLHGIVW